MVWVVDKLLTLNVVVVRPMVIEKIIFYNISKAST